MVIGQVERRIPCQFNLHFSSVCPHPFSDQSGQAEHPLDWGFECSQQSLLLCSHCQHKESDNGELSAKNIVEMKMLPDILNLPGLSGGWGGQYCIQVQLPLYSKFPCFVFYIWFQMKQIQKYRNLVKLSLPVFQVNAGSTGPTKRAGQGVWSSCHTWRCLAVYRLTSSFYAFSSQLFQHFPWLTPCGILLLTRCLELFAWSMLGWDPDQKNLKDFMKTLR